MQDPLLYFAVFAQLLLSELTGLLCQIYPNFPARCCCPRYWLLWLGIGFLWLLVQLPYPVIYRLGTALGRLAMRVMKSRARIARRNLELCCFPEMSAADREALLVKNFESLGMGLMETGMAWFWPTHRVARWTETSGVNEVVELLEEKQGILLIGIHFLTLEWGCANVRHVYPRHWRLPAQR